MRELQILIFKLGNQLWGMDIRYVKEVVKVKQYTEIPNAPMHVLGVFNLRGQIVPLLNLASILGVNLEGKSKAIVLELDDEAFGVIVEEVLGVIRISESSIEPPPPNAGDYIRGVIKHEDTLVNVIDIEKIIEHISYTEAVAR